LQQVFTSLSPISSKVIALLVTNNRIDLLDQVALAYLDLLKEHQGKETA